MSVVSRDERYSQLPREPHQHRVDPLLLLNAVILKLEIIIPAEDLLHSERVLAGAVQISGLDSPRNRSGKAG